MSNKRTAENKPGNVLSSLTEEQNKRGIRLNPNIVTGIQLLCLE